MDSLKFALIIFLFFIIFSPVISIPDTLEYSIDYYRSSISINAEKEIKPEKHGNIFDWQLNAALKLKDEIFRGFIKGVGAIRFDAWNYGRDLLIKDIDLNKKLFSYLQKKLILEPAYTALSVKVRVEFPFFGEDGFVPIMYRAGKDIGRFPTYPVEEFSTEFTGLVIDARGLDRKPTIAPKVFDEDHNLVYFVDFIYPDYFKRWGSVGYSEDPYYHRFVDRVGNNPLRVVALKNEKLMDTDITISNRDASILLQYERSRESLKQGRVVIIIDYK